MLDKFKTFVALSKYKSYTVTAQKLFCSQPTISQQIKVLEKHYGVQLIQRKNGEVLLTEKGQQFLKYVQEILQLHENLKIQMNEKHREDEVISVYVSHYLATYFFHELFSTESEKANYPFEIQSQDYAGLKNSLMEGKTSFAIMPYYAEDDDMKNNYKMEILFEEEFVLIVPKDHELTKRKVVYTKDLQQENVFLPMSRLLQQRIRSSIERKGVYPKFSHMSDFNLIKQAVHLNMGVGFIPKYALYDDTKSFDVIDVKGLNIMRQNAVILNRFKQLSPYEKAFIKKIKMNFMKYEKSIS